MPNAIFYETKLNEVVGDPASETYRAVKVLLVDGGLDLLDLLALGRGTGLIELDDELWAETETVLASMPPSMNLRIMHALRDATARDLPITIHLSRPILPGTYHANVRERGERLHLDVEVPMSDPDPGDPSIAKAIGLEESYLDDLGLDLACTIARIDQLDREGVNTCGGLILRRLIECDLPRLRQHLARVQAAALVETSGRLPHARFVQAGITNPASSSRVDATNHLT